MREINFEDIINKTGNEISFKTMEYKINKAISNYLFLQNYRERQERILEEVFKRDEI